MAVIIKEMQKPQYCFLCHFSFRVDNGRVACSFHPAEHTVADGESTPDHCPLKEVKEELTELVRCKDCKYCSVCANGYNSYCNLCHNISYVDGFCSEAEPKGK